MSNPLMEKMLDLPEFEVTDFKQNDNDMGFYVQTKNRPTVCPVCGCYIPNLVIYKSRKQTVRDISPRKAYSPHSFFLPFYALPGSSPPGSARQIGLLLEAAQSDIGLPRLGYFLRYAIISPKKM